MDTLRTIYRRDDDDGGELNPTTINLAIALLALVLFASALVGVLLVIRRRRRLRLQSELPLFNKNKDHNPRRLTITANHSDAVFVVDEKQNLVNDTSSPPASPIPEIRITFPEEEDDSGKRKSGRVVLVRIGEKGGIGLEPCDEEDLPPYRSDNSGRFQSLDLDRMGGLKEKDDKDDLKRYS